MSPSQDIVSVSFWDLFDTYRKQRLKINVWAGSISFIVFLLLLFRTPLYQAEATFRQAAGQGDNEKGLKGLFTSLEMGNKEAEAIPLMTSRHLLKKVVAEMGLQVEESTSRWMEHAKNNLTGEFRWVSAPNQRFQFANVVYEGDLRETYTLIFRKEGQLELVDRQGKVLTSCRRDQRVETPHFSFALKKVPSFIEEGVHYQIQVTPLEEALEKVGGALLIKPNKISTRLLHLSFLHPERSIAVEFLDRLMGSYQDFLKKEHDAMAQAQFSFLDKRQALLTADLKVHLNAYAHYLKKSLRESGVLGLSEHLELTALPLENGYAQRLAVLALEKHNFELGSQKHREIFTVAKSTTPPEHSFQGLNKEAALDLHLKYNQELEALKLRVRELAHLIAHVRQESSDITALTGFITDPLSSELLRGAGDLTLALHDPSNRSEKEQERIREALESKKRFLHLHLQEILSLEQMRAQVIQEKIIHLRHAALQLVQEEETQVLAEQQLFREHIANFPDKWLLENELKFKQKLGMRVVDALSQFTETKVVQHLLSQVESKPLDLPYASAKIRWPGLSLISLCVFIGALSVLIVFFRCRQSAL